MLEMKDRYKLPVGFSDHTLAIYASLAAVTLGASVIEKHLTLSRLMYGSDAKHSLEPSEFIDLVQGIREIEDMLTNPVDKDDLSELAAAKSTFEKSIVSVQRISKGAIIEESMIALKKPGTGMPPRKYLEVVGKRARRDIETDRLITEDDIADD
jgi:N-acetylneuraminate synthase